MIRGGQASHAKIRRLTQRPREAGDVLLRHCTPISAALLQLPE
jgi:hypothetical protein